MAKRIVTIDKTIKELIIEDIARIYVFVNKEFTSDEVKRSLRYNSRSESGFQSMIKMAKKMAVKSNNYQVNKIYNDIEFLLGFYKRGQK